MYILTYFRPTFVHHFIIRDSVEENITNLFSNDNLSLGSWDDITLSQLIKVFERNASPNEETSTNAGIELLTE